MVRRRHLPTRQDIDRWLVAGAAIFGIGWGMVGSCPGPALVTPAAGSASGAIFIAAMRAGMLLQHRLRAAGAGETGSPGAGVHGLH